MLMPQRIRMPYSSISKQPYSTSRRNPLRLGCGAWPQSVMMQRIIQRIMQSAYARSVEYPICKRYQQRACIQHTVVEAPHGRIMSACVLSVLRWCTSRHVSSRHISCTPCRTCTTPRKGRRKKNEGERESTAVCDRRSTLAARTWGALALVGLCTAVKVGSTNKRRAPCGNHVPNLSSCRARPACDGYPVEFPSPPTKYFHPLPRSDVFNHLHVHGAWGGAAVGRFDRMRCDPKWRRRCCAGR